CRGWDCLGSGPAAAVPFAFQQARRAARQAERAAQQGTPPSGGASPPQMKDQSAPPPASMRNTGPGLPQQIYLAEAKARIDAPLSAAVGFLERLASVSSH